MNYRKNKKIQFYGGLIEIFLGFFLLLLNHFYLEDRRSVIAGGAILMGIFLVAKSRGWDEHN
jgi:hypothetical protein